MAQTSYKAPSTKFKYYFPDLDTEQREVMLYTTDPKEAANEAGMFWASHRQYDQNEWPIRVNVISSDGTERKYEVSANITVHCTSSEVR